jgi:diguanylate cyclase (GGDEF)-like protein/putative nucleotidyltransferase with HDIG domain
VLGGSGGERQALRGQLAEAEQRVRALEAQLVDRANRDQRTRLLALDAFLDGAERALRAAAEAGKPVSAIVIDVDGFRELNARRGPKAGDLALAALAQHLRRLTRSSDVLGRSGADEITIVMPGTDLAGAHDCCERLIRALDANEIPGAGQVSVSAGIAAHAPGETLGDLLAAAAAGLDRARALGGARASVRLEAGLEEIASPAQSAVIEALANTLLERDRYTGEHSESVVELARGVARQLGISDIETEIVAAAALLHDIGKVAIPDAVLHKPGRLTEAEWELMKEHPVIGERILAAVPGMASIAKIVRHEHEHWNGAGYPDNLSGEAIPIGSRIILACDAYSAITTDRPYRSARSHADAIAELARCAGTQFDPKVTEALIGCLYWQRQAGRNAA